MKPARFDLEGALRSFLAEDLGVPADTAAAALCEADVTSAALVPADRRSRARLLAKESGVIAGLDVAAEVFRLLDPAVVVQRLAAEGERVERGQDVLRLHGASRALLAAERVALNLVQRMSGIASLTARFVAAVAGTGAVVLETRKTAPGLRWFDKRAVRLGGGQNHRMGLYDQILVKENHIAAFAEPSAGDQRPIEEVIRALRERRPGLVIEIEVWTPQEAERAARAGAELVLLDNFGLDSAAEAVARTRGLAVQLEFSGGVTLEQAAAIAATGVHRISVGALTHSVRALDVSLLFDEF